MKGNLSVVYNLDVKCYNYTASKIKVKKKKKSKMGGDCEYYEEVKI